MRTSRPRYPKMKDVAFVHRALEVLPKDRPFNAGWRQSEKGTPNFRFATVTNERSWTVDVYAGDYYIVRVGDRLTEECSSVPSIILYLHRMLGLNRVSGNNERR
jgi:hypothetical protein